MEMLLDQGIWSIERSPVHLRQHVSRCWPLFTKGALTRIFLQKCSQTFVLVRSSFYTGLRPAGTWATRTGRLRSLGAWLLARGGSQARDSQTPYLSHLRRHRHCVPRRTGRDPDRRRQHVHGQHTSRDDLKPPEPQRPVRPAQRRAAHLPHRHRHHPPHNPAHCRTVPDINAG